MNVLHELWRPSNWEARIDGPDLSTATTWTALIAGLAAADIVGNVVIDPDLQIPAKLAMMLVAVAIARWSGVSWTALGLSAQQLRRGLLIGGAAGAAIAAVIAIGAAFPTAAGLFDTAGPARDDAADRLRRVTLAIPIGTVAFEELLFRSVAFGALLSTTTVRGAVFGQAVLFGLWHIVPALDDAAGSSFTVAGSVGATVFATAAAGLGFGWLRVRANSVVAPAVAHLATNVLGYLTAVFVLERRHFADHGTDRRRSALGYRSAIAAIAKRSPMKLISTPVAAVRYGPSTKI